MSLLFGQGYLPSSLSHLPPSIFQQSSIDMHSIPSPQSSDMVRRDSGNSIEDYKILQSAAAFAQFTPSSKVCLLSFVHHLRATFQTLPFLCTPFLVLSARTRGLPSLQHWRASTRIDLLQDSDFRPLWSCFMSSSLRSVLSLPFVFAFWLDLSHSSSIVTHFFLF